MALLSDITTSDQLVLQVVSLATAAQALVDAMEAAPASAASTFSLVALKAAINASVTNDSGTEPNV